MPRYNSRNVYDGLDLYFAGGNIPIRCQGQAYKQDPDEEWKWDDMDWEVSQSDVMETAEWVMNSLDDDEKKCWGIEGYDEDELREYILEWANQHAPEEWEKQYKIKKEIEWKPRWK